MEFKKIEEGMTAPQVAELLDHNFNNIAKEVEKKIGENNVPIATENRVGGITAKERTRFEQNEVVIDPETGRLYTKVVTVDGEFVPDEEDLTAVAEVDRVVAKFKDRDTTKGKGYIILRTEKPIAEQMVQENTIYEIRYDFDLGGGTLEIPANCTLDFKGGSFDNGVLTGVDTVIMAAPLKIFGENLVVNGSWNIDYAYAEWFGAEPGEYATTSEDCIVFIRKALAMNGNLRLLDGTYCISDTIHMASGDKISGHQEGRTLLAPKNFTADAMISATNTFGCIRDIAIWGTPVYGVKVYGATQGFRIENVSIKGGGDAGLFVSKCWYAVFKNLNIWKNKYGIKIMTTDTPAWSSAVNGISFENCWLNHNTENSVYANGHTMGVSFNTCTFENTTNGPEIKCENFYIDMTFLNCYMETKNVGFDVKPSFVTGQLNIFGGIYTFNSPTKELANLGTLEEFNCIGCTWIAQGTVAIPSSCIISNAVTNFTSARFPDDANVFSATGKVITLNTRGHFYNTKWNGCDARTWQTNNLRVTHEGKGSLGCSASLSIGLNRDQNCDYENCIKQVRLGLKLTGEWSDDRVELNVDRKNASGEIETNNIFSANNTGRVWFRDLVNLTPVLAKIDSTSLPDWSGWAYNTRPRGAMYFCPDIKKLAILLDDGKTWVDAMGNTIIVAGT